MYWFDFSDHHVACLNIFPYCKCLLMQIRLSRIVCLTKFVNFYGIKNLDIVHCMEPYLCKRSKLYKNVIIFLSLFFFSFDSVHHNKKMHKYNCFTTFHIPVFILSAVQNCCASQSNVLNHLKSITHYTHNNVYMHCCCHARRHPI